VQRGDRRFTIQVKPGSLEIKLYNVAEAVALPKR
jgi:hypothetical protein